jgi:arabinose-5-phosphate isomerase
MNEYFGAFIKREPKLLFFIDMKKPILNVALECIQIEIDALQSLTNHLNNEFERCVATIVELKSRVVLTGIGKSAIVAQKVAATMNSTGSHATFLHAADALHGDIGLLGPTDILVCLSKSGETQELKLLIPIARTIGCKVAAITANPESYLAKQADFLLYTPVTREADPNNLAPTASTAAQMALGDALAICLMYEKGFSANDFGKFHPAGSLGKQLYLRVHDVYPLHGRPVNSPSDSIQSVILTISKNRLGATVVCTEQGKILGIITDGDLRRMLEKNQDLNGLTANDILSPNPKSITADALAIDALETMRAFNISQLIVTDGNEYKGIVHLHDLVREGLI